MTQEQIKANEIGYFNVVVEKGTEMYVATVKSYAGVIDELSDFPAFFNTTAVPSEVDPAGFPAVTPNVYGYYIVVKDLGSVSIEIVNKQPVYTYSDTLGFTQVTATDYNAANGFNGVLDGLGHSLNFKLASGGLVGWFIGNGTIQNLEIIFEDATTTHYGVFGYMAMTGGPVIDNCYIEQTNNHYGKTTTFGLMGRPRGKLILENLIVYGFNSNHPNTYNGEASAPISSASKNAYVICGRAGADTYPQAVGFTKVYTNGSGQPYDTREGKVCVPLADVSDASGFNSYWNKETNISWKGADDMVFSAVISTVNEK